jgi:hypothetical protein
MSDMPSMPKDWWPENGIIVVAKDGYNELALAITKESYFNDLYKAQIEANLRGLRLALWQYKHMPSVEQKAVVGVSK